ncbi:MAG: hypothetical protein C5B51_13660 [Terriglobia bacterium]|nr:MAG: hypothetical protein C5B51_13660 [Terriglobia bacterium]
MNPRQWAQVKRVFAMASGLDPSQRAAYLQRACPDAEVRHEVESLLAQLGKSDSFLGLYSSIGDSTISHFEVHHRIGEGGMAIVYEALDRGLERRVALKVLQPLVMARPGAKARLLQEARLASALNHPNIVTIYEVGEENGVCFIAMEYLSGETLNRILGSRRLPLEEALAYALPMAEALAAAHTRGIVHGDLKPANVMVTQGGQVKLLDFGLARALTISDPSATVRADFGTKAYMAPELLNGSRRQSDSLTEIFSFGLIFHELLSGRHAFGRGGRDELVEAILTRSPETLPNGVPAPLVGIVRRCLERDRARRYSSMHAILKDLSRWRPLAMPSAPPPRAIRSRALQPKAGPDQPIDAEGIEELIRNITYGHRANASQTLREVESLLTHATPAVQQKGAAALKDLLLTVPESGVTGAIRDTRKAILALVRTIIHNKFSDCFEKNDLEHLDLYQMDFSEADLRRFSFAQSFLVQSSFRASRLVEASFAGAFIRNVDFAGADLADADFTDADWFNALGLTQEQLGRARRDSLRECPADEPGMHIHLSARYEFPFDSWSTQVRRQLEGAWKEYLRPGGLKDAVLKWHRGSSRKGQRR